MAMELSVSSRFGLPLIRYSSIWSRKTRLQATTKAELQSTIGVSDPYVAPTSASAVPVHRVTVNDRQRGVVHQFLVPEDQYILHTAESQDISLPFACRHGCCTSCAVRVKSGEIRQPEALGISSELKSKIRDFINQGREEERFALLSETKQSHLLQIPHIFKWMYQGYALLCVGFPTSDIEVETQDEDEVYWLQFGRYFARGPIERDDYALELAMADE